MPAWGPRAGEEAIGASTLSDMEPLAGCAFYRDVARAALAYLTVLEGLALDLGKLAFDLWLFASAERGFVKVPVALTTGSSLMRTSATPT